MSRNSRRDTRQFQNIYPQMYPGKKVKTVTFIVTHQCNLRCSYCYEGHKSDKRMDLETAQKCVDLLFAEDARNSELVNDVDAHGLIIEFIGGEPFLEIELIDRTMEYFLSRAIELGHRWATQYMINISTNGTLGDDSRVEQFMRKYSGRLSIGVTIDGAKEAHDACRVDLEGNGSYDRAIEMFRRTGGSEGKRHTKYTIAPGNVALFAGAVRHLVLEEGLDTLNCNCVYEEGWTIEHARELYRQLVEVSDGYGRNFLLPRKLAVEATAENVNTMKMQDKAKAARLAEEKAAAQALAERLEGVQVKIKARAGQGGKLFGSITSKEISEELKAQFGLDVGKSKIVLSDPIKSFGAFDVKCKLGSEVSGVIHVLAIEDK